MFQDFSNPAPRPIGVTIAHPKCHKTGSECRHGVYFSAKPRPGPDSGSMVTRMAPRPALRRVFILTAALAAGFALGGYGMVNGGLQGIGSGFNKAGGAVSRLM